MPGALHTLGTLSTTGAHPQIQGTCWSNKQAISIPAKAVPAWLVALEQGAGLVSAFLLWQDTWAQHLGERFILTHDLRILCHSGQVGAQLSCGSSHVRPPVLLHPQSENRDVIDPPIPTSFLSLRSPAHMTVLPTFKVHCPPQLTLSENALKDKLRSISRAIPNPVKVTGFAITG